MSENNENNENILNDSQSINECDNEKILKCWLNDCNNKKKCLDKTFENKIESLKEDFNKKYNKSTLQIINPQPNPVLNPEPSTNHHPPPTTHKAWGHNR